ncbi:MAG: hypothetical protein IJR98_04120, partial [Synergistaceae bacterium]|nr:hypothetical protein [Synergistaceae bacterium]
SVIVNDSLTDESITNTGTKQGSKSVLMKVAVLSGTAFGQTVESYVRIACAQSMDKMEEFCRSLS